GIERVDAIRFAGAFGTFIDPKYAMVLGLIPDCDLTNVKAVGNAAGTGARMALINRDFRREIEATVRNIEKIETALEPEFQTHFVHAMAMPNKVDAFPQLAEVVALPTKKPTAANDENGHPPRRRRSGGRRGRT
ncbi:MAG: ASKHA domain-containing protein, partial [Pseudomonadota bacterium]